jgi:hypothetical protein
MERELHYATVSEAIEQLRKKGFVTDFNLEENCIAFTHGKFEADDFEIVDVYRYEGNTDPADEATVYAIESRNGVKGILVTGYGASADSTSTAILAKLRGRK